MSEILWEATNQVPTIEVGTSFRTLSAVGPKIYWGNSSSFKWLAKVDFNCNILFYQVDRIYTH
jgi:hypothetical protein